MTGELQLDEILVTGDGPYYVRSGGCSLGCGACCKFMVLPLDTRLRNAPQWKLDDFIHWARLHGVDITDDGDWLAARIPLQCQELDEETLKCKLFGTPERPDLCARTPSNPFDIAEVADVCTYNFDKFEHLTDAVREANEYQKRRKGGELV